MRRPATHFLLRHAVLATLLVPLAAGAWQASLETLQLLLAWEIGAPGGLRARDGTSNNGGDGDGAPEPLTLRLADDLWRVPAIATLTGTITDTAPHGLHSNVFRPFVALALIRSDNLLGLVDAAAALRKTGSISRGDTERRRTAGVAFDKEISRQHVSGILRLSRNTFDRLSMLDHTEKEAALNWNWRAGDVVSGAVGLYRAKKLAPFDDFHLAERNLVALRRETADVDWQLPAHWHLSGGVVRNMLRYDLVSQQGADRNVLETSGGLANISSAGNSIGLRALHTEGTFLTQTVAAGAGGTTDAKSYRQNEVRSELDWHVSTKTRLRANAGWIDRQSGSDAAGAVGFTGFAGRGTASWEATAKTAVSATLWRELVPADDRRASTYAVTRGGALGATWRLSDKTALELRTAMEHYLSIPLSQGLAALREVRSDGAISLQYMPTPFLTITPVLAYRRVTSDTPLTGYRRTSVSLTAQYQH